MLTEICQYLHNWFNRKPDGTDYPKEEGVFTVENGQIDSQILVEGQYFRIIGSLFNDGVHKFGDSDLQDEQFSGVVWSMGVPPAVVQLADDISAWVEKNGSPDSPAMSPFSSESFGGYSYSKSGDSVNGSSSVTWQNAFSARLSAWRKI